MVWALSRQAERWPELDTTPVNSEGLPPRDAAFAHAIYDAALRRWITLEWILNRHLRQPLSGMKPGARAVLIGGAAQMLLLDRVPVHAAINESVEWAKRHLSGSLAGMVNGVLRNVWRDILTQTSDDRLHSPTRRTEWTGSRFEIPLPDGSCRVLREPLLPEDPHERLRVVTSCPQSLYEHWLSSHGEATARTQAIHLLASPPTIINIAHRRGTLPEQLEALSVPHSQRGSRVWTGPRSELSSLLARNPDLWVQDSSSAACVLGLAEFAPAARGGRVVDLCAGQGTKTRQFAAVFSESTIIASDPDEQRMQTLRHVGAGLANVRVVEAAEVAAQGAGAVLVLADVPCSNSGVLARRVEARYRWSLAQMDRLVAIQREILAAAASMVAPGGLLVYSTCSIEREENQQQAAWAAGLGLELVRERVTLPEGAPGGPDTSYRDGAYCAVLRRTKP